MRAGLAFAFAVLSAAPAAAAATSPKVTARAAIIVDAESGEVIWARNPDLRLHPASTTKVMTAIVAVESEELDRRVPVSAYAAGTAPSKLWLKPGQTMAVRDLLYAVLLKSANDAAVVVAEGVAGSVPAFSRQMNAKARAIGATRSSFSNPHGLTQEGHLSTAADLARIFRHAMDSPLLREVLTTRSIRVPVYSKGVRTVAVHSHNRLLTGYEHQVIGKTGYTRAAKRCFVGAARGDDGREVIVAMLGSNSLWPDARALVEYGLEHLDDQPQAPPLQMARLEAGRAPAELAGSAAREERVDDRPVPLPKRRYSDTPVVSAHDAAPPEPRLAAAPRAADPAPSRYTDTATTRRYTEPVPAPAPPPVAVARVEPAPAPETSKPAPIDLGDEPPPDRDADPVPMGDAPDPMPVEARPPVRLAMLDETPTQAARSAGAGRWAVELGPFETPTRAESTRRGLADLGYGAQVSGRILRLGAFSSRSRADRLADRLRLSGYRPTIVALR
jgi:D-alanyl-D-alanine carboxypeptidase